MRSRLAATLSESMDASIAGCSPLPRKRPKPGLPPFETPVFHRTLAEWLNAVIHAGFTLERVAEPKADDDTARRVPALEDTRVVAYFLHVLCHKR